MASFGTVQAFKIYRSSKNIYVSCNFCFLNYNQSVTITTDVKIWHETRKELLQKDFAYKC
jgi:hypothetical protein